MLQEIVNSVNYLKSCMEIENYIFEKNPTNNHTQDIDRCCVYSTSPNMFANFQKICKIAPKTKKKYIFLKRI